MQCQQILCPSTPAYHIQWTSSALTSQNENGGVSVGTFVNFVWMTIGENFLRDHISAKEEDKEL